MLPLPSSTFRNLITAPFNPLLALLTADLGLLTALRRQAAVPLYIQRPLVVDTSLPRRRAYMRDAIRVREYELDLFKRLACRLWEHEEDVEEHADAEDAEY